jgi:arylsulfatase A-like enzyme/Flp pilus assembly protein TadD
VGVIVLIAVMVAVFVVPGMLGEPGSPSVVLISIDTCRADYLGCYNPHSDLTPNIDALARTATVFRNCAAPAPLTLPSHTSMLTGKIPLAHGVHNNGLRVPSGHVTLAEMLQAQGYTTGAVVGATVLDHRYGLARGFATYDDRLVEAGAVRTERHAVTTSLAAIDWLEKNVNQRPLFLFCHYYDPHEPYQAPDHLGRSFGPDDAQQYAGEIAYVDHWVGAVLDRLRELDLYDSSLIILTSDHGEMLGEHGEIDHGYFVYESAIKVPLIVKLPGQRQPRTVDDIVGLIDIPPTVCSLLGLASPADIQGRDLSPLLQGVRPEGPPRFVVAESLLPQTHYGARPLLGLIGTRWKYIETTDPELYDLSVDRAEAENLTEAHPDRAQAMKRQLRAVLTPLAERAALADQADLDPDRRQALIDLGYVGAGRRAQLALDAEGDDPKGLIDFHNAFSHDIADLAKAGELDEAIARCRQLVQQRPQAIQCTSFLAGLLSRQGSIDEALGLYDQCIAREPDDPFHWFARGLLYLQTGRAGDALADFQEAVALGPVDATAHVAVGRAHAALGQTDQAERAYQAALTIDPESRQALTSLAWLYTDDLNAPAKALPLASQAVSLNADDPEALGCLGWALARQGRYADAVGLLGQAVQGMPTPKGRYRLGWTLEQLGQHDAARRQYDLGLQMLQRRPDDALARDLQEGLERVSS